MKKTALFTALIALAIGVTTDADARVRARSSHGSSHTSDGAHTTNTSPHAAETHGGESTTGAIRSSLSRSGRNNDNASDTPTQSTSPSVPEDPEQRRMRQEKEAARARADAETLAARKLQQEADAEKRRQLTEQAAINRLQEEKRKDAEAKAKNRELALLERQKRQAAWEGRCQIKAVMTDDEIATCKEVWTTPAR